MKSIIGKTVWLMLYVVLIVTTACVSTTDTATMMQIDSTQSQGDSPSAIISTYPTIFFPQQESVDGEREVMAALIFGTLIVVDDCIRVNDNESNTSYLLVWPPDFTLVVEGDTIQILNGDDEVAARIGDNVRIDGGEVKSLPSLNESIQKQLPSNCLGPYWIVGESVSTLEISE